LVSDAIDAALHGLPAPEVQKRLTGFLKQIGANLVLDIGPARDLALCEAAAEFLGRCAEDSSSLAAQFTPPFRACMLKVMYSCISQFIYSFNFLNSTEY
jgi:hypothetical protein